MFFLPSSQLIMRFSDSTKEDRPEVWRETRRLIAAYPWFGCGLGGYESAFYPFKASNPAYYQEYAHNDYLQYLAEMGVVGSIIAAVPLAVILAKLRQSNFASARGSCLMTLPDLSEVNQNLFKKHPSDRSSGGCGNAGLRVIHLSDLSMQGIER